MAMLYFGVKWDAPAYEDAVEVTTPVGERCLQCAGPVAEGESGVLMPCWDGIQPPRQVPVHIECHLRSILGGVAHLEGRCTCHGATADIEDTDAGERTYRQEAREVMSWLIEHQT